MPEDPHVDIGRLRWLVQLVERVQTPEQAGPGIAEETKVLAEVHADIQAVGGLTFWGGEQTDTPITHRIFMRFQDCLDQTAAVLRATQLPDRTYRTEVFRVRRIKELGGRKRFVLIEAELEKAKTR